MRYRLSGHARQRMKERAVTEGDLNEALDDVVSQWDDSKQRSIVINGRVSDGRFLTIFVAGSLPAVEPYTIKSVAWKDGT